MIRQPNFNRNSIKSNSNKVVQKTAMEIITSQVFNFCVLG